MKQFSDYLKRKQFTGKTIQTMQVELDLFLRWLEKENIPEDQVRYQDMLLYMKHSQQKQIARTTLQKYLGAVKHYYNYLIESGLTEQNPAEGLEVKGIKRKILYHIFDPPELNSFYNNHPAATLAARRNKVMLGLLVYQGLKTEELISLETSHIKLREGKIEVPGGHKREGRTLQLEPHQVLDLYDYVLQIRREILALSGEQTEKLFIAQRGSRYTSNQVQEIARWLKTQHGQFANVQQLRASVITKWLKQYNLREVQYMAGHRYISSTEAYQQNDMEGLTEEVNKFHPLG